MNYVASFLSLSFLSLSLKRKTDIIKSKPQISMVTAVPACTVSEPTRQAADSGTKTLGWSFRRKKNFTDSEAKLQRRFIQKSWRDAAADMNDEYFTKQVLFKTPRITLVGMNHLLVVNFLTEIFKKKEKLRLYIKCSWSLFVLFCLLAERSE